MEFSICFDRLNELGICIVRIRHKVNDGDKDKLIHFHIHKQIYFLSNQALSLSSNSTQSAKMKCNGQNKNCKLVWSFLKKFSRLIWCSPENFSYSIVGSMYRSSCRGSCLFIGSQPEGDDFNRGPRVPPVNLSPLQRAYGWKHFLWKHFFN